MRAPLTIIAASVAALLTVARQAEAQAPRTFVSGHGSDSNPCSLADPCRSFAQASTATNAGGEIVVLDSAGYGTLTINKSITITNPGGVEAGITAPAGQTAIKINALSPNVVTLRGLTLEGGGVGLEGINFGTSVGPGSLNIIDCVVKDFTGNGISIDPAFFGPQVAASVLIANSFVLNNGGSGILIQPGTSSTSVNYAIDHTTIVGNGTRGNDAGILFDGSAGLFFGTISSSEVTANHNLGVNFIGGGLASGATFKNSILTANFTSILNSDNNGLLVNIIDHNYIDSIENNGLVIQSDGTNVVFNLTGSGGIQLFPAFELR